MDPHEDEDLRRMEQLDRDLNEMLVSSTSDDVVRAISNSVNIVGVQVDVEPRERPPQRLSSTGSWDMPSADSRRNSETSSGPQVYSLSPTWMDSFHVGTDFNRPATRMDLFRPVTPQSPLNPCASVFTPSPPLHSPLGYINFGAIQTPMQIDFSNSPRRKIRNRGDRSPRGPPRTLECGFCKNNGESPIVYRSHNINDGDGRVVCPNLRNLPPCRTCGAFGDNAHTEGRCPKKQPVLMKLPHDFKYFHPSKKDGDNQGNGDGSAV